ncbi:MAG TPA: biotin transporter BioY [Candidatus Anaerotruncus excrementipullorum]|uniref:Biotin transporter n=1 Tax=Candidatus Anaerotruncus excrementipullorum TaxID=2838465 RepID=A0A9D1WQ89_9FIRM|nr:biotin transporter BioY [Candidatus Anaerotruncus excrementipullorum]
MHNQKTKRLTLAALFAALTALMAQMVLPLWFTPVPFSLAIVAVFLTGAVLDWKTALLAQGCYLLLGLAGVPVFSYFGAGPAKLVGPTGGYLLAYPLMAAATAWLTARWGRGFLRMLGAMAAGLLICYTCGTLQLMALTGSGLWEALGLAVIPFALFDLLKAALSSLLAVALHRALRRARLVVWSL